MSPMKQQLSQPEGAKADLTEKFQKDKRLKEALKRLRALKLSREKRTIIMKELKKLEKTKWVQFIKQQEQNLKKMVLEKKKIIEKQVPKTNG